MKEPMLYQCPFCGNSELYISEQPSPDGTITWYTIHHAATNRCSLSMIDSSKEELIERWNVRHFDLPSDVYVLLESSEKDVYINDQQRIGFQKGAKWMREKVTGI